MIENLSRLSFRSMGDCLAHAEKTAPPNALIWRWHETLGDREQIMVNGICELCQKLSAFSGTSTRAPAGDPFSYRMGWLLGLQCDCGLAMVDRMVLHLLGRNPPNRPLSVYHVGEYSRLRRELPERGYDVVASQFDPARRSGEIVDGVRYENLTTLSLR